VVRLVLGLAPPRQLQSKGEIVKERNRDKYETLGVVKPAMSSRRNPVAVMINRNTRTNELSFQFGLLRRGHIDSVRYWREGSLIEMAGLAKVVAQLVLADHLGATEFTVETLKKAVKDSVFLEFVEEYVPEEKKKNVSMTLGERAKRNEKR